MILCDVENTLVFSSIGYKSVTHHHDTHHGEPIIYLASDASELETIVVEGENIEDNMQSLSSREN